ncbi:hypothetical protein BJ875DRAFT_458656 [Amylocarpus encephaloides]|uniref:Uncharacterized protein n=1 Tax=Amylocarpus encephaloides TaxID=45428 RepID=A0A9P7YL65_9HELO|nr:hypothetical protein BJ875DRAFT_458656 [Amylocarpus encephaloides]
MSIYCTIDLLAFQTPSPSRDLDVGTPLCRAADPPAAPTLISIHLPVRTAPPRSSSPKRKASESAAASPPRPRWSSLGQSASFLESASGVCSGMTGTSPYTDRSSDGRAMPTRGINEHLLHRSSGSKSITHTPPLYEAVRSAPLLLCSPRPPANIRSVPSRSITATAQTNQPTTDGERTCTRRSIWPRDGEPKNAHQPWIWASFPPPLPPKPRRGRGR